jgi:GNAT superfamily N-acetyltransferase
MAASLPITVRKVESKPDFNTLLTFPWKIYRGDPYWVPPLLSMQRHKLDRNQNPSWEYMEGDYFIAWRGAEPVGTVAAFVNHRHNEFHQERTGFFGLFELIDDQAVANALLDTAADYVRARGCDTLRGPASFSTNEEWGVITEGFDDPPVVLMPYTPRYYLTLLENAPGFGKAMDFFSYHFSLGGVKAAELDEKLVRVTRKNSQRRGITVRSVNARSLKTDVKLMLNIFNSAWDRNWGFVPFSDSELKELVSSLGQFLEPQLAFIAAVEDKPVAFLLAIPDINQALRHAYPRPGKPDLISKAQVFWHWKVRSKITRLRVMLMGVKPGYRGIGVESAMFIELFEAASRLIQSSRGWQYGDGGWVLETNEPMQRLCDTFQGYIYKRYRCFERTL